MEKQLTLRGYRSIDLLLFTVMMIVFELLAVKATIWFGEVYCISLFILLSMIVMMRWGGWSVVTIVAGAITFCLANGAPWEHYIIYVGGDLFILFDLFWFNLGKAKMREGYLTVSFVLCGYVLVETGRSFMGLFFGGNFLPALIGFLGTDLLSALLALLIIMIARKQNGLYEDQITYLRRINAENTKHDAELEV
jgi:hypothetical protein